MSDTTFDQPIEGPVAAEPEGNVVAQEVEQTVERTPEPQPQHQKAAVPHAALHEERERRKQAEARMRDLEQMVQQGNTRLQELIGGITQSKAAQPEPEPLPDVDKDPVAYFKAIAKLHEQKTAKLEEKVTTYDRMTEAQKAEQGFLGRYQQDAHAFGSQAPDFMQAYAFLAKELHTDLVEGGLTPAQAQQELIAFERKMANAAWQRGENAAAVMHKLAIRRGFKAQLKAQEPKVEDGEKEIEVIERGQQRAARSMPATSSGNPHQGLTFAQLARMSDAEYAAVPKHIRDRALGR